MKKKNNWQLFFDHHAPEYMQNVFVKNTIAEVEFVIRELNLKDGARILDVGCGTGRHAVELARRGYRVTGVDLSSGMLAEAARAAEAAAVEVEYIHADAAEFDAGKTFDAAICLCEGGFSLLGAADDPIERDLTILKNISRHLEKGRGFILTTLSALRKIRKYSADDIAAGHFDPIHAIEYLTMEYYEEGIKKEIMLREKGFLGSELKLLFGMSGFEVRNIYGGTAGNWGHRPPNPDEYELMVIGHKK